MMHAWKKIGSSRAPNMATSQKIIPLDGIEHLSRDVLQDVKQLDILSSGSIAPTCVP